MQTYKKIYFYLSFILIAFFSASARAAEYQSELAASKLIHTVQVVSSWCGNMSLSTKVGKLDAKTKTCIYEKETPGTATDTCGPHYLNGGILEQKVGKGYTCAATHAHNLSGQDGLDEFKLILNAAGQYIGSDPTSGEAVTGSNK